MYVCLSESRYLSSPVGDLTRVSESHNEHFHNELFIISRYYMLGV
jgi:hypothetical protein